MKNSDVKQKLRAKPKHTKGHGRQNFRFDDKVGK